MQRPSLVIVGLSPTRPNYQRHPSPAQMPLADISRHPQPASTIANVRPDHQCSTTLAFFADSQLDHRHEPIPADDRPDPIRINIDHVIVFFLPGNNSFLFSFRAKQRIDPSHDFLSHSIPLLSIFYIFLLHVYSITCSKHCIRITWALILKYLEV